MLIPKLRLHSEIINGEEVCSTKYYVWSEEDCQSAIDMFNSFSIVKAS